MLKVMKKGLLMKCFFFSLSFFSFQVFCLCFFYYLYFISPGVLNWEAGKGIKKTLNSMKTDLGGETINLIWSKGCWRWVFCGTQYRNHPQLPELLGCCSDGIKHNGKGYPGTVILPAHPIGAVASILHHCMAALRKAGPLILKFKKISVSFFLTAHLYKNRDSFEALHLEDFTLRL